MGTGRVGETAAPRPALPPLRLMAAEVLESPLKGECMLRTQNSVTRHVHLRDVKDGVRCPVRNQVRPADRQFMTAGLAAPVPRTDGSALAEHLDRLCARHCHYLCASALMSIHELLRCGAAQGCRCPAGVEAGSSSDSNLGVR